MTKFITDKLYKIRFYDHSTGSQDKIICETVGWIIKEDKTHVVLSYWIVDTDDDAVKRANIEPSSIIKSCIIRSRKLG